MTLSYSELKPIELTELLNASLEALASSTELSRMPKPERLLGRLSKNWIS